MTPHAASVRDDEALFEAILSEVQKPLRYIGGEWNEVVKDHRSVDVTFALAFPDVYEIGMSHLGFRILYSMLNARPDTAAERVFCPWPDMGDALRRRRHPLSTLETGTPLRDLDVVGFSLQYEMTFSNVLEMLDLAGIPLRSAARGETDPLVAAGGPVVFNCEPIADFLDVVLVGDAEELLPEFLDVLAALKRERAPRAERIRRLARIPGVYAPGLYRFEDDGGLLVPTGDGEGPFPVRRRIVYDLDRHPFPDRILVPHAEIVHDRVSVEIMRGCPVGCRFCQAGYIYRPTRERDPNQVRDAVIRSIRATGYDGFSLASLNTGEYGAIQPLLFDLMDRFEPESVSVSLSSMHASTMTEELAKQVRRVRKSGFTIAPEAGTQRLRNVINKNLTEEQILRACGLAFEAGWDLIKLYFMIGLPTETEADVDGLVDLAHEILAVGRRTAKGRRPEVTLSASSFVPKPVTPFQWLGQERRESLLRKQDRIAARVRRGVRFKHHECDTTFLEAVFSRGDRRLGAVLERAWRSGARFDGWSEHFRNDVWTEAFRAEGIDPEFYAHGDWPAARRLPWDAIDPAVNKKWLALELRRALAEGTLSICGPSDCHGCAPFAKECVKGIVSITTDRPLDASVPVLATPFAPGPGKPADAAEAPALPRDGEVRAVSPMAAPPPPRYRYRVKFRKRGRTRFLGHLDLMRTLLRSLRRARVPLLYSQGFNPKPRVQFGPALPVGIESFGEYFDFDTVRRLDEPVTAARLAASLPRDLEVEHLREIPPGSASLGETVRAARYRVEVDPALDVRASHAAFRGRGVFEMERRRRDKRVRVTVNTEAVDVDRIEPGRFVLTIPAGGREAAASAEEILGEMLGPGGGVVRVVREDLLVERDGCLVSPILETGAGEGIDLRTAV